MISKLWSLSFKKKFYFRANLRMNTIFFSGDHISVCDLNVVEINTEQNLLQSLISDNLTSFLIKTGESDYTNYIWSKTDNLSISESSNKLFNNYSRIMSGFSLSVNKMTYIFGIKYWVHSFAVFESVVTFLHFWLNERFVFVFFVCFNLQRVFG